MELGGLWWINVLNSSLPLQRHRPDKLPEHQDPVSHMEKEKKEKKIYLIAPKVHRFNFGMIRFLFRYSTDAGYVKLIIEISSTAPEAAGRDFPFSSLFAHLLAFSFGYGPSSVCRSP